MPRQIHVRPFLKAATHSCSAGSNAHKRTKRKPTTFFHPPTPSHLQPGHPPTRHAGGSATLPVIWAMAGNTCVQAGSQSDKLKRFMEWVDAHGQMNTSMHMFGSVSYAVMHQLVCACIDAWVQKWMANASMNARTWAKLLHRKWTRTRPCGLLLIQREQIY